MAFELKNIVPWGRNLEEYKAMFNLTESDLDKNIVGFGDGPASFNTEMTKQFKSVISIDPIYKFPASELKQRIQETKDIVLEQTRNNLINFVWSTITSVQELEQIRMFAMDNFLNDFEKGKIEGRYIPHELPNKTNFKDLTFDLGISSHFLILYSQLGLEFHKASIHEMLRVSREIRIFPILDLDAKRSALLDDLLDHFENDYSVTIEKVDYMFQIGGNEMLRIKRK